MTKTLGQTIEDNHRIGETTGEETINAKLMKAEVIVEIETEIE